MNKYKKIVENLFFTFLNTANINYYSEGNLHDIQYFPEYVKTLEDAVQYSAVQLFDKINEIKADKEIIKLVKQSNTLMQQICSQKQYHMIIYKNPMIWRMQYVINFRAMKFYVKFCQHLICFQEMDIQMNLIML